MENEKRLIDVNAAIEEMNAVHIHPGDNAEDAVEKCVNLLHNATTVNAVELPPIKIGDTAFFILDRKVYRAEVYYIRWSHHERFGISSEISASVSTNSSVGASFDDFGKTMFLTKEEANAALAKMLEKED